MSESEEDEGERREAAERDASPFHILFVCTGNTCRSPLAEAIARERLSERGWRDVTVSSAGISAFEGAPASEGSLRVAVSRGLDLSGHRSAPLTHDAVERADLILVMSASHRRAAEAIGGRGKTTLLAAFAEGAEAEATETGGAMGAVSGAPGHEPGDPWAVPDPFGGDEKAYETTYEALDRMVERVLTRLEGVLGR